MNRHHQSNPFLSDWDDDNAALIAARAQTNAHLFDAITAAGDHQHHEPESQSQTPAANRRSSCSQAAENSTAGSGGSAAGAAARAGLYRRNMSSFEAASLLDQQQQQHQMQQLENGSGGYTDMAAAQKDLIAKMTADFQSAIQTNEDKDGQFENMSFNPFDPFETIVDDDSMGPNSPAPAPSNYSANDATGGNGIANESKFVMPTVDAGGENEQQPTAAAAAARRAHDSIDDDDEELVSTPVRNIKSSSPTTGGGIGGGDWASGSTSQVDDRAAQGDATGGGGGEHGEESDSIRKATLFASLLASAEQTSASDPAMAGAAGSHATEAQQEVDVEATTRVIKGSPNSASGDNDRPVSFFDPFETVIDEGALHSLVSDSHRDPPSAQTTASGDSLSADETRAGLLTSRSVAESVSVETVIENPQATSGDDTTGGGQQQREEADQSVAPAPAETTSGQQETPTSDQYTRANALERPSGRRLQSQSGIAPPQPTPMKKRTRPPRQRKPSFQEDSSDSSEEDDRIQIVICPRDASKTGGASGDAQQQQQPVIVPLLPPPPSKSSMRQARERGQVEDIPSPIMGYKSRQQQGDSDEDEPAPAEGAAAPPPPPPPVKETGGSAANEVARPTGDDEPKVYASDTEGDDEDEGGAFVIPMTRDDDDDDDDGDNYGKPETPLYDDDTSYVLEEFPTKYEGPGWEMMLRYPPKKKLTATRFWKKIFVKLAQVPLAPLDVSKASKQGDLANTTTANAAAAAAEPQMCWALQIYDHAEDKKPMQEIPIQATYTVSEISSQLFDQFGKIFTIKLQYIFYKERVGVRQGQLARFIHTGHIGSSTTSGGHGVDPISIGAIKRMGAPIEHSPQISQIIKLGCTNYEDIKVFKETLEDCLFRMAIHRDRALTTYKTEEVQMAVRDETYIEINQIGTVTRQLARVRLFFLSFLNGTPIVEVGINDFHRQGREVVGRMDILPVVTEEWIRLEAWELHSTVECEPFEDEKSRIIKLTPPDATFFELMRFRIRPPRNRELPLQISANMSVTRTRVSINCEVMVPGCVSRKHGQIPCENIAIRVQVPECWIYFFREEKHFRMGSKKSVNRRPGKVKGIERFLGGSGPQDFSDDSSLIEVTSGQAKYEHHHHAVVWRAARWPKETQAAYVQNTMKIRLPLTAYDKMPETFNEYVHVEYTMPATTVSHTTLRSISVNPCDEEPPEKYVKYAAKFEYKVKMRLSVNLGGRTTAETEPEASPIVIMKQAAEAQDDLQREADSDGDDDDDDDDGDEDGRVDDLK